MAPQDLQINDVQNIESAVLEHLKSIPNFDSNLGSSSENIPKNVAKNVIVAVSGGIDSMVLGNVCQNMQPQSLIVTVDHDLRPESKAEAVFVSKHFQNHHTLFWEHGDVTSKIQEQARAARFRLLIDFAKKHDIKHVFLGHHANDQMETFMMRALRGSSTLGLGGMKPTIEKEGVFFHRPFLQIFKKTIKHYANHHNIPHVHDPSNDKESYQRVRIRNHIIPQFTHDECQDILKTINSAQETNVYIEKHISQAFAKSYDPNTNSLDLVTLKTLDPFEIMHILRRFIHHQNPLDYPPSLTSIKHAIQKLVMEDAPSVSVKKIILKRSKNRIFSTIDPRIHA